MIIIVVTFTQEVVELLDTDLEHVDCEAPCGYVFRFQGFDTEIARSYQHFLTNDNFVNFVSCATN